MFSVLSCAVFLTFCLFLSRDGILSASAVLSQVVFLRFCQFLSRDGTLGVFTVLSQADYQSVAVIGCS